MRVDQVGHTGRVGIDSAPGLPRQDPGATGVVEVDVGGEDCRQVVNSKSEVGNSALHGLDGTRRPALEEHEPSVARRRRKRGDHLAVSLKPEVDGGELFHGESVHGAMYTRLVIPSSALRQVLSSPTVEALWELRADLLERGTPTDSRLFQIIGDFHAFLDRFATTTSSRDLNHLASKLDIGAVGGVVLEQLFEGCNSRELAMRVLTGGISEGLMVLASRQYVRAQEGELAALLRDTAWNLYEQLWRWTAEANPELQAAERRRLIDRLTTPLREIDTPSAVKAVLAGRLYQVLVIAHLRDNDLDPFVLSRRRP